MDGCKRENTWLIRYNWPFFGGNFAELNKYFKKIVRDSSYKQIKKQKPLSATLQEQLNTKHPFLELQAAVAK